jgi:O-antigen/teichoic acid export membrane protein
MRTSVTSPLESEPLEGDLKGRSIRGGSISFISQALRFLIHASSTMVLARLLTPQDYGLIAMVTAITGFLALFRDFGLSTATIQRPHITHPQVTNIFWINVGISSALILILAAGAPIIAWFYREPRLTPIALTLGGTFIFSGLAAQHSALLSRQMRFERLALVEVGSAAIGAITGLLLAILGNGYWALVWMSTASSASAAVLVWIVCSWRPGLPDRGADVTPMLSFGSQLMAFDIMAYFSRNLDNVLLGKFWGADVLGLYSRAYNIMMLPIAQIRTPLGRVALPALSRLNTDPRQYRLYYMRLVSVIALVSMPLTVFLFVCADQVIYLLLGTQWLGAVPLFRILCVNAYLQPVAFTTGMVLISLGQSRRYFMIGMASSVVTVVFFVIGLPWGATGVAIAYTAATLLFLMPGLVYGFARSPISIADFLEATGRQALASLAMGGLLYLGRSATPYMSPVLSLGVACVLAPALYALATLVIPGGRQLLREWTSYRFFLFPTRESKTL